VNRDRLLSDPWYRALVVEDEPLARADLVYLLGRHPQVEVRWQAASLQEAKAILASEAPDVVFLDVMLGDGDGFDVVPYVAPSTALVFVTAHSEHAIRAFEVNALDYLLKPVRAERLHESIERLGSTRPDAQAAREYLPGDRVLVQDGYRRCFVALCDLQLLRAEGGNYATLFLGRGDNLTVRMTLKHWERRLPAELFCRIHRQAIVNLQHVEQFWKEGDSAYFVRVRGLDESIRVSRGRISELKRRLSRSRTIHEAAAR
jgi:two-component system LytT family response regulator